MHPLPHRHAAPDRDRRALHERPIAARRPVLLADLAADVRDGSLCGHGITAPNPLTSAMRYFEPEFDDHIVRGRCPAGVCKPLARRRRRRPMMPVTGRPPRTAPRMTDLLPAPPPPRPRADRARPRACSRRRRRSGPRSAPPSPSRWTAGRSPAGSGQTILELCRDNGIEIPTLCYEPKLPGFGACRMCVVELEGEDAAAHQLLPRRRGGHGRPDPDRRASASCARRTWS